VHLAEVTDSWWDVVNTAMYFLVPSNCRKFLAVLSRYVHGCRHNWPRGVRWKWFLNDRNKSNLKAEIFPVLPVWATLHGPQLRYHIHRSPQLWTCWYKTWPSALPSTSSFDIRLVCLEIIILIYEVYRLLGYDTVHIYGPGSSVGISTDYDMDGPGSNPGGDEIFRIRPDRPWGPHSLL